MRTHRLLTTLGIVVVLAASGRPRRTPATVLGGNAERAEQPRVNGHRSGRRPDSAGDARGAGARGRACRSAATVGTRSRRWTRGSQSVRPLHLARPARIDDAG